MRVIDLKEYILDTNSIPTILENLECIHITHHDGYYTCGNPDGDNPSSVSVYENGNLTTVAYTRDIKGTKQSADIFDLICFYHDCTFPESLRWTHTLLGLDYYKDKYEDVCDSIQILHLLSGMNIHKDYDFEAPLKPIDKSILKCYLPLGNRMWEYEGISLKTQKVFSIMYDDCSNRIIMPLFDETGELVGVKGRLMKSILDNGDQKYMYSRGFNKSKYLYGLYQTYHMIKQQGYCIIYEGEKSVMLAYEHGIGSVAIAGCKFSRYQVEVLSRLNVPLIICFDKDRTEEEIKNEADKFIIPVNYMLDKNDILDDKESPIDDWNKWKLLVTKNVYANKRNVS